MTIENGNGVNRKYFHNQGKLQKWAVIIVVSTNLF